MLTSVTIVLSALVALASAQVSGVGRTTRYWDCCKGSCAWQGKAAVSSPIKTCDKNDNPITDVNAQSGCDGGSAFMCSDQTPWAINDNLSYGFAAANIRGGTESSWCCACYELTFTSGTANGKKLIVQTTNTGGDLGENHFDLAIPGGGVGYFNGCAPQYGAPADGWGERYGGVTSAAGCNDLPAQLQPGCFWRFNWFQNAINPEVTFKEVTCPAEITAKTGCVRNGPPPSESQPGNSATADSESSNPTANPSSSSTVSSGFTTSTLTGSSTGNSTSSSVSSSTSSTAGGTGQENGGVDTCGS
ncbi:MAG: hypothetical protein M1833_003681 [Piccolia ochrophora]|nr:MAG: hypothetical protein M1833_003681 [Piccolia ochrophora]